ncbi:hypothetical protein K7432_011367 [Basidiobolus ranarum]|uniref:Centrosomal protein of 135 kDa n=1 Tax=Basidiobolus ranarum TaxID=34480 RepID=A0ABR2WMD9_9FUNG
MVTNETYEELADRLRTLGYTEPFDRESTTLVSRLLSDLSHISETCQLLQEQLVDVENNTNEIQNRNLRNEVSKLTAENNQLHNELVTGLDRYEDTQREISRIKKEHEIELENIRFMTTQYNLKLQEEREKTRAEQKKLEDFLIRNRVLEKKAVGMTMYPARIALTSEIEVTESKTLPLPNPVDPHIVDLMQLSERRIQQLVDEKNRIQNSHRELQNTILRLRSQIETREREITRFGSSLEKEKAEASFSDSSNERSGVMENEKIKQLELQVECLQEHILELEHDLKQEREGNEAEDKQLSELKDGSGSLFQSLAKLENLLTQLDDGCLESKGNHHAFHGSNLGDVEKTMLRATESLMSMESKLEESKSRQQDLTAELKTTKKEVESLQNDLLSLGKPMENKKKEPTRPLSRLEARQKDLEKQVRDLTLKVHNLEVRKMALEKDLRSHNKKSNLDKADEKNPLQDKNIQTDDSSHRDCSLDEEQFKARIENLEREKIELTQELEQTTQELSLTRKERTDLIAAMKQFEEQLQTIQDHIDTLTTEKENLRTLYEQTSKELRGLRKSIKKQTRIGTDHDGDSSSSLSNHSVSSHQSNSSSHRNDSNTAQELLHKNGTNATLKNQLEKSINEQNQLEKSINEKNQHIERLLTEINQMKRENSSLVCCSIVPSVKCVY